MTPEVPKLISIETLPLSEDQEQRLKVVTNQGTVEVLADYGRGYADPSAEAEDINITRPSLIDVVTQKIAELPVEVEVEVEEEEPDEQ